MDAVIEFSQFAWLNHSAHGKGVRARGVQLNHEKPALWRGSDKHDLVSIHAMNSQGGDSGIRIVVPFDHVPDLIDALNRMIAGPLALLAIDAEASTTTVVKENQ